MTFAKGVYLHLLWLLPILLLLTLWSRRRSRRDLRALFGGSIGQDVAPEDLWRRRAWRSFLVFLGLSLAVVAMAQPRWGHSWKEQEVTGLEIIVALDVSRSMDAQDVDPSRIERARRETLDLIEAMPSSRIGLVLFAGGAYPRMPQTLDHQALRGILSRTDTQTIRAQGSSIGAALKEARGLMDLDRKADRAILLLSDGESWDRGLQEETTALAQAGIRVYSVGIGTLAGAPIPKPGGGFKTDMAGEVVLSQLNESALKEVASATEGAYVQSVGGAGDTREVVSALNRQLARSAQGQQREKLWQERYQWPLGLGLVFLLGGVLLGDGKRRVRVLVLCVALGAARPGLVHAEEPGVDVQDARSLWGLGESYMQQGRYEEAYKVFAEIADRSTDDRMRVGARYNSGSAAYGAGKLEEAVSAWERVLEQDPQHSEAAHNAQAVKEEIAKRLQPPPPEEEEPESGDSSEDEGEESESDSKNEDSSSEQQESQQGEREDSESSPEPEEGERGEMPELAENDSEGAEDSRQDLGELMEGVQQLTEEEALRLLEAVEEGRPYVVVGGDSSEKDW